MSHLHKIGVLSLGRVGAIFGVIFGLLNYLLLVVQTKIPAIAANMDIQFISTINNNWFTVLLSAVFFTGLSGFVLGIIAALIYNKVVVKFGGGIKIEIK